MNNRPGTPDKNGVPAGITAGFTLIEVLIVVVIIAVLAALIVPRYMNQSERAVIAEAHEQLGAIRRGQQKWQDMMAAPGGATAPIGSCGASAPCDPEEWAVIGITPPAGSAYDYGCDDSGECTAIRVSASDYNGATVTLNVNTAEWTCGGTGVRPYANTGDARFGCTLQ